MDRNKSLTKNTIILGIGQFVPKIISIIILPILTKAFTTEEYGIYDLVISLSSFFVPLMTLQIGQAVFRFLIDCKDEKEKKSYITTSIFFVIVLNVILFLVTILVALIVNRKINIIIITFMLFLLESIYDLVGQISRGIGNNKSYSFGSIIFSSTNMIIILISYYSKIININYVLISICISYFIATIYLYLNNKIYKYIDKKSFCKKTNKELLQYSAPMIPNSIALWVVNLSDRLIITYTLGESANGIYAVACKIPNMFGTVYNIFNLAWTELASRTINDKDSDEYYTELIKNLYPFLIGILGLLISFSPIIFKILVDEKFAEGYSQLPILYLGILFSSFSFFYGGLYVALKKTKQVGFSSIVGAIINIVINLLFIRKIGIYAASISTLIAFLIIFIYRAVDVKKYIKIKYDLKEILFGIILLIVLISLFYINTIVSMIIGLLICILYNLKFNYILRKVFNLVKEK